MKDVFINLHKSAPEPHFSNPLVHKGFVNMNTTRGSGLLKNVTEIPLYISQLEKPPS